MFSKSFILIVSVRRIKHGLQQGNTIPTAVSKPLQASMHIAKPGGVFP